MKLRIPKYTSLLYYINFYYNQFKNYLKDTKNVQLVKQDLHKVFDKRNKVIIGANFAVNNGIYYHLQSIKNNSDTNISLFPNNHVMAKLSPYEFVELYKKHNSGIKLRDNLVVHSHVYPWFIQWCDQQKSKNESLKWIHTYHAHYFPEYSKGEFMDWQKEFNRIFVKVASKADVKISVSKWQQIYYKDNFNIDTIYIPNGVNVEQCDQADSRSFMVTYHVEDFILNVSRHDPVKNPIEFVRLAIAMPDHKFVMIGKDFSEELFLKEYKIEPPKNLTMFGEMSQKEVQNAIAACRCLVSTSKKEGLPTLVLEGMTQGKPVVVSNEQGSMEAINNGDYGFYYELGDIDDLKKQTLLAFNDTFIGVRARQRILEEYDWRVVIKKLDKLYMKQ